jgi:two-component system chemotaxis response regulator CheB
MMRKALIIGGSAGSLDVLLKVLPELSTNLPFPIIIIVHRKQGMDSLLTDLLANRTALPVKEADEKEHIKDGTVYICPSDYHLLFEKDFTFSLDYSEKINYSRPSIDVSFHSAAEVFKEGLTCLLLSGSNSDGVNGLISAKRYGARTWVQDPKSAQVTYMPEQAIAKAEVTAVLQIENMANQINNLHKK